MQYTIVMKHYNDLDEVAKVGHLVLGLLLVKLVILVLFNLLKLVLCDELALVLITDAHRKQSKYLCFRKGVSEEGLSLE